MKFVVVCTGNTCRSPMGAALLKKALDAAGIRGISVDSAGIAANPGAPVSAHAAEAMRAYGIDIAAHRAKPLTREMIAGATVLAMTKAHAQRVKALAPAADVRLFSGDGDIIDPFAGSLETYKATARALKKAADKLANAL